MNAKNKKMMLQEIENEGLVQKADNAGGRMENNEFRKLKIYVECTEDIEKTLTNLSKQIEESTNANNALSKKIWWLNFILTAATIVLAVGALVTIYLEYFKNNA